MVHRFMIIFPQIKEFVSNAFMLLLVLATYTLHPMAAPWWLVLLRLGLAVTYSITMVTMLITGAVASSQYRGQIPVIWSPDAGGWTMHCISTASEWLMALRYKL